MKYLLLAALLLTPTAQALEANLSATVKTPEVSGDTRIRTQLSSRDAVVLSSELSAKIADLPKREGESFKRGDTLVTFDCSLNQAQLKKAQVVEESAKRLAQVNTRMSQLKSIGELELQQSLAKVQEAEADVNYMQASVQKCVIKAPFDGRIAKRLAANHQYVNTGTPVLDIIDTGQLELQMMVPSRWLAWLKPGMTFNVAIEELGKTYSANIIQLGARIDAVSQTLTITGRVNGNSPELLAGMSGWANFDGVGVGLTGVQQP